MDKKINLSYLIVTMNKLSYLKSILEKLIAQKKPDEEILIADGASTDGTRDYLVDLKRTGAIDNFISEPDFGTAHALNKLILIAKGTLFMTITDDDAYDYSTLNICKKFMLEHSEIDLICTEGGVYCASSSPEDRGGFAFRALTYADEYQEWSRSRRPFSFCELGLILRRASLPIIGLRDPSFRRADAEFSLRITAGKAKIAWYSGYSYVNILNKQSVSKVYMKKIKEETDRLNKFYLDKDGDNFIIEKIKVAKNKIRTFLITINRGVPPEVDQPWLSLIKMSEKWLEEKNSEIQPEFIYNH